MKRFQAILVLSLLLIPNYSEAKTKNIGNGLIINIPKNYKYFEIDFEELYSIPELKYEFDKDPENFYDDNMKGLGFGIKTKFIIIADSQKTINGLKKFTKSQDSFKKLSKEVQRYAINLRKKYVRKYGHNNWNSLTQAEKESILLPAYFDLFKKYKSNNYAVIVLPDEKLSGEMKEEYDELIEEYDEEIKEGGREKIKEDIEESINEWQEDDDWKEAEKALNRKINIVNFEIEKTSYNDLYLLAKVNLIKRNKPPSKGEMFWTLINDQTFFAMTYCELKCDKNKQNLSNILKPINLFEIKISKTIGSNLVDELKELNKLYEEGALTKEEFEKAKKKLLN